MLELSTAFRQLIRRPGFTLLVTATLAIGIGGNVAIFSGVDAMLLRPLPYADADRLVCIDGTLPKRGVELTSVTYPDFAEYRQANHVFETMAAYRQTEFILTGISEPERLSGVVVSINLLDVLGMAPIYGRGFASNESEAGNNQVVLLSHSLWRRRFGSDPAVVGQSLTLEGRSFEIIGVMPAAFGFPDNSDLWTPIVESAAIRTPNVYIYKVIGKLKQGASEDYARADLNEVLQQIIQRAPQKAGTQVVVIKLRDFYVKNSKLALKLFLAVVGFVLLIACINVAGLLIARFTARQTEFAIRAALGAGRWRIVRLLLCESLLLASLGGAAGLVLGIWGKDLLVSSIPVAMPAWMNFDLDFRVIIFLIALSLVTCLVFGVAPALEASAVGLIDIGQRKNLKNGRTASRLRDVLTVSEIAIALVLLIGASLTIKAFFKLQGEKIGFRRDNVIAVPVNLPRSRYAEPRRQLEFYDEAIARVNTAVGATVAATSDLPLAGSISTVRYSKEGMEPCEWDQLPLALHGSITNDYFTALGIPLIRGREFDVRDGEQTSPAVVIISETLARLGWSSEEPIGKRLKLGPPQSTSPWLTIVGVVADVGTLNSTFGQSQNIYVPLSQAPTPNVTLLIRTETDPSPFVPVIRKSLQEIDRSLPLGEMKTMERVVAEAFWRSRIYSWLFSIFALFALGLAALGVYGVLSQLVAQRSKEIGIRMALGAQRRTVLAMILRRGLTLTMIGVAIGVGGALALTRLLAGVIHEVSPNDPASFVLSSLIIAVIAVLASFAPAHRST